MHCRTHWTAISLTSLLAVASGRALAAGGSYLVDDASITPDGHCQVESWVRALPHDAWDVTSVPACSIDDVEWSASATHGAGNGSSTTSTGVGAKWAYGDIDKDGLAIGVAVGGVWTDGVLVNETVYAPASVALTEDHRWVVHLNAGVRHAPGVGWRALVGAAVDMRLAQRWHVIAEFSAVPSAERTVQVGARYSISDNAEVDLVAGHSHDDFDEHWITVGLNLGL